MTVLVNLQPQTAERLQKILGLYQSHEFFVQRIIGTRIARNRAKGAKVSWPKNFRGFRGFSCSKYWWGWHTKITRKWVFKVKGLRGARE